MRIRKVIAVALCISIGLYSAKGQIARQQLPFEKINSFSDRNIYIAGENIYFLSVVTLSFQNQLPNSFNPKLSPNQGFSEVLYADIVSPTGNRIIGNKFLIDSLRSSGTLKIPTEVITGKYFLRTYTRYMRNYGPYSYCYLPITIVNPYKSDVLSASTVDSSNVNNFDLCSKADPNEISIITNKTIFNKRENITITIEKKSPKSVFGGLNITVVPESSINPGIVPSSKVQYPDHISYIPESKGLIFSGKLMDNISKKPLQNSVVNLSIFGNEKDFNASTTDSSGRFYFILPKLFGTKDIFLSTNSNENISPFFLINNDFCDSSIALSSKKFKLTDSEKEVALKLAKNYEIDQIFTLSSNTDQIKREIEPFYGKAPIVIDLDQYILLPKLEDYINELLPIKVVNHQGIKTLKILNTKTPSLVDPLLLLDLVPIYDITKILALTPNKVSKIEVVNEPYIKGNHTYQGIVSIFSRKNDYAGVDLPSSGIFLNYKFLENTLTSFTGLQSRKNSPDARNTLFWESKVVLDKDGTKSYKFEVADTPGIYTIILRGLHKDGNPFYCEASFKVE